MKKSVPCGQSRDRDNFVSDAQCGCLSGVPKFGVEGDILNRRLEVDESHKVVHIPAQEMGVHTKTDGFGRSAVLSGHVHRAQVLTCDLTRAPLAAPVIYPGSVERTSWAERDEGKGFAILTIDDRGSSAGELSNLEWVPLPARPMVDVNLKSTFGKDSLEAELQSRLSKLPVDAVVHVHYKEAWESGAKLALSAANLRALAPPTMNISLARERQ